MYVHWAYITYLVSLNSTSNEAPLSYSCHISHAGLVIITQGLHAGDPRSNQVEMKKYNDFFPLCLFSR